MESNQVHIVTTTVLRGLEQLRYSAETRLARQIIRDVADTNRHDRIHDDPTVVHPVVTADLDAWPFPDTDATPDLPESDSVPKALGEQHDKTHQVAKPGRENTLVKASYQSSIMYHAVLLATSATAMIGHGRLRGGLQYLGIKRSDYRVCAGGC